MGITEIKGYIHTNVEYHFANVACIDTGEGLVLIDTPSMPEDVAHWKSFVDGLSPDGVKYIINTHQHFDHIIGNSHLGGKVIMQEKALEEMCREGGTLREGMAPSLPGVTREDADFILSEPLVQPEIIFSDKMALKLGRLTLRLFHIGGHTAGSICVYVEEDKILLSGDNVVCGIHPFMGQANIRDWIEALRWMKGLEIETIIPGHGNICRMDELDRLLEYFIRLWYLTEDLIKKGRDREGVINETQALMLDYYDIEPDMLEGTRMIFNVGVSRLYDEVLSGF